MVVEVEYTFRDSICYFIGSGCWTSTRYSVPNPSEEAATPSPHDIKSKRRIDFNKNLKKLLVLQLSFLVPNGSHLGDSI